MNDEIKKLIKRKNWIFQCQRNSDNLDYTTLNSITQDIRNVVNSSKLKYYELLALSHMSLKNHQKSIGKY